MNQAFSTKAPAESQIPIHFHKATDKSHIKIFGSDYPYRTRAGFISGRASELHKSMGLDRRESCEVTFDVLSQSKD